MPELNNKVALVAGGSGGIGLAIAQKFIDHGATVYLAGRDPQKAQAAAESCGARPVVIDVVDPQAWQTAIAEIERQSGVLDILVNAMGQCVADTLESATIEGLRQHMAVNVEGILLGSQAALPLLRKSGKASVVNIGSIITVRQTSGLLSYGSSKTAMIAMSKAMALHFAENNYGIRVNVLHPGGIRTEMLDRFIRESGMPLEEAYDQWGKTHPIGRFGMPEEIADAALYFASDASSFTTGAELYVDGGAAIKS